MLGCRKNGWMPFVIPLCTDPPYSLLLLFFNCLCRDMIFFINMIMKLYFNPESYSAGCVIWKNGTMLFAAALRLIRKGPPYGVSLPFFYFFIYSHLVDLAITLFLINKMANLYSYFRRCSRVGHGVLEKKKKNGWMALRHNRFAFNLGISPYRMSLPFSISLLV